MVARKGELLDHAIKSPRYIQVYSTVRDWIYHGSYKPGSRLPTVTGTSVFWSLPSTATKATPCRVGRTDFAALTG